MERVRSKARLLGIMFTPQPDWDDKHPVAWLAAGGDPHAVIDWIDPALSGQSQGASRAGALEGVYGSPADYLERERGSWHDKDVEPEQHLPPAVGPR